MKKPNNEDDVGWHGHSKSCNCQRCSTMRADYNAHLLQKQINALNTLVEQQGQRLDTALEKLQERMAIAELTLREINRLQDIHEEELDRIRHRKPRLVNEKGGWWHR